MSNEQIQEQSKPIDLELLFSALSAIVADYGKSDKETVMKSVKKVKNTVQMMMNWKEQQGVFSDAALNVMAEKEYPYVKNHIEVNTRMLLRRQDYIKGAKAIISLNQNK